MKSNNWFSMTVRLAVLALLISSCTSPTANVDEKQLPPIATSIPASTEPAPTSAPVEVTNTPNAPAVLLPSPTVEIAPTDASQFSYQGIHFTLDPSIASSASGQIVPENPATPDGPYWDLYPQHASVTLSGYPDTNAFFTPVIEVYPVEEFRKMSPNNASNIDALKDFLAQKPTVAEQIPFLQVWNAGQVFHSNVQYLNFQNGSGVRYLAIYAQYPAPINSYDLFYTFQGLTADGRNAVSIIMPVSHPSLPENPNAVPQATMEANMQNSTYYADMSGALTALPAHTFTPDLEKLDALVASLMIE